MGRSVHLLEQVPDVVEPNAGPETETPGLDAERFARSLRLSGAETRPEQPVHHDLESLAGSPGDGPQLRGDVVVQGERRPHALMLSG